MAEIQLAMESGRNGWAARELRAFLATRPGSDRAAYLLGVCEKARARAESALEAWRQVPPDSQWAGLAILGSMELQIERGRLADAEQLVMQAMNDPRLDHFGLRTLLVPEYVKQGRFAEAERLIEEWWGILEDAGGGTWEQAINLAQLHMEILWKIETVETLRSYFDQASGMAPDDDRVLLGKANLAIRNRSFVDAKRWLEACLHRRPEDAAVWRARLSWAMAANRLVELHEALEHLPVAESTPAQINRLAAWLAAHRGDFDAERQALERLLADDPADLEALDRLAEFAVKEGDQARAAELRDRKAKIQQLNDRYRKLYDRNQPSRDAPEMARLAEQLGRVFEARLFLSAAIEEEPDRADFRSHFARLCKRAETVTGQGRTLAELFASELGDDEQPNIQKIHDATNQ
jgi:enediyne biosynthesis protein E4